MPSVYHESALTCPYGTVSVGCVYRSPGGSGAVRDEGEEEVLGADTATPTSDTVEAWWRDPTRRPRCPYSGASPSPQRRTRPSPCCAGGTGTPVVALTAERGWLPECGCGGSGAGHHGDHRLANLFSGGAFAREAETDGGTTRRADGNHLEASPSPVRCTVGPRRRFPSRGPPMRRAQTTPWRACRAPNSERRAPTGADLDVVQTSEKSSMKGASHQM